MNINEALREKDLKNLVKNVFEIDNYQSKIGDDRDTVVLTFTVDSRDPAKDLENFLEMGYDFILDSEATTGELDDGKYRVFAELERSKHVPEQIVEMLNGLSNLTGIDTFRFRYHKEFKSQEATLENLEKTIPLDGDAYDNAIQTEGLNNFSKFFSSSYIDDIKLLGETITLKRIHKDPINFKIVDFGSKQDMHEQTKGPIMLEGNGMAETIYLTKYIGNYNINKVGTKFILEKEGYALILEKANGGF
jgi:hypothetical protein